MIEAEAGPLAGVIQTDNTLEAIWVWSRYGELTRDTSKYHSNIENAKIYCDRYPPWLEEGNVGYDYYRVHNAAWGLAAATVYCDVYGDTSYYAYADTCADYIMKHPLNIYQPSWRYINSFVTGWAAGNLYHYAILRNNNAWKDTAIAYGERLVSWIALNPQFNLSYETWAMSSGTIVWGMCNSVFRNDTIRGKNWIDSNANYIDTFQVWRDCGDGYNWDNAWNVAYCNAHRAMYNITGNPKYKRIQRFIANTLLAYDTDSDGGIQSTTQDPDTEDMCWVSSYLAMMGLVADTDAAVIRFVSPQNLTKYDTGDSLEIKVKISNFGIEPISGLKIKITGDYEDSAVTNIRSSETQSIVLSKRCLPQNPDTFTLTATTICTGDENPLDDTMAITFFVDFPAVAEDSGTPAYRTGRDYNLTFSQNPFSKSTIISYQLPVQSKTSLEIYDIGGRLVKTLVNDEQQIGNHNIKLDAKELATGVYFINLLTTCHSACPSSVWRERLPAVGRYDSEESKTKTTKKLILLK